MFVLHGDAGAEAGAGWDSRLDVLRGSSRCGWHGVHYKVRDKRIIVQLKNSHYPTPARVGSLQDAVLELVRRYEGSFGRKLFASGAEACAAVAAELARPPWGNLLRGATSIAAIDLRGAANAAYQAHEATCQQAPTHAKALQSALLHAHASKAPTGGAAGGAAGPLPTAAGPIAALGSDVYRVEALLAQRQRSGKRQFLVR